MRIGVAGHNLFDVALRLAARRARGVAATASTFEMLLGMAPAQAEAVRDGRRRRSCSTRRSCTRASSTSRSPTWSAGSRRTRSHENFLSAAVRARGGPTAVRRASRAVPRLAARPGRSADRRAARRTAAATRSGRPRDRRRPSFANTPTPTRRCREPALGRAVLARRRRSRSAPTTPGRRRRSDGRARPRRRRRPLAARRPGRATRPPSAPRSCAAPPTCSRPRRAELIEVMAARDRQDHRRGRPRGQRGDRLRPLLRRPRAESSTAVRRRHVRARRGSTVVTPPWNFPVAIPAGGALAALAAGSAVVIKPAPQARERCGAVHGRGALAGRASRATCSRSSTPTRPTLGERLIAHPARRPRDPHRRVRDRRAVPLLAPRPAAARRDQRQERDHRHAVRRPRPRGRRPRRSRAFGHAGQKCSAASLVILVGSVAHARSRLPPPARRRRRRRSRSATPTSTRRRRWARSSSRPPASSLRALTTLGEGETLARRAAAARRQRPAVDARACATGVRPGSVLPPHRVLRPGARHHDGRAPSRRRSSCRTRSTTASPPACTRSTRTRSSTGSTPSRPATPT